MNYYRENIDKVLNNLQTSLNGLTEKDVFERLKRYGKNELPKKKKDGLIKIFFKQIINPIVIILIVTVIFSFLIGEVIDACVVMFIVFNKLIVIFYIRF